MSDVGKLVQRIEAAFAASEDRLQQLMEQHVEAFEDRQERLEEFERIVASLTDLWLPRLEALAKKFGDQIDVQPHVEPGQRIAIFDLESELATIELKFSVSSDADVQNVLFSYDLRIIPILMQFESHSEIKFPLESIDKTALANWIDDRIVGFVKTFLAMQENQYYLRDHMVEDPVAKVKFPQHAAGATLEVDGHKYYFIGEATLREFQEQLSHEQGSEGEREQQEIQA